MSTSAATAATRDAEPSPPPFPPSLVEEMLKLFVKAVRAHQLYLHNNPIYLRALELLRGAFAPIWAQTGELVFTITETDWRWSNAVVLHETAKSADSLPWLFFKDGIRELTISRGFEDEEVVGLLEIIQRARHALPEQDDLLTMLWEKDFGSLRYRFVDLALENAPPVEASQTAEERAEQPPIQVETEEVAQRAGVVNIDDFDSTLYFLDEREVDYLRNEIRLEYEGDLRRNVLAILFDLFEQQTDKAVRDEIAGLLDNFILHMLSATQFRAVAYLLREAGVAGARGKDITETQRQRLASLPERLSDREALAQLLQSLDEAAELPPQEEITELFEQLRPTALETVFSYLTRLQNVKLRTLLESAAQRLASAHTAELVKLIDAKDDTVALEAIRRSGGLKTAATVPPLTRGLAERDAKLRLATVQALAEIGSTSAMQALERAVGDKERDVRVATARALGARNYKLALPRVESVVKGKPMRDADLTEKMAFFELFGALCGDPGVPYLDGLLNSKGGFFGKREDPEMRACAAMALGKIGTPKAMESLRRASNENEKEVVVRNAINRALRGGRG